MVFRLETLSAINEYPKISDPEIIKAIIGPIKTLRAIYEYLKISDPEIIKIIGPINMKVKTEQQAINRK